MSFVLLVAVAAIFVFVGFGKNFFVQPNRDVFLGAFFQEPFVGLLCLAVAWFVASSKSNPSRTEEYLLLNSLPIPATQICDRLLGRDLWRYAWVPGLNAVLYLGLHSFAPVAHLLRLSILSFTSFVLVVVLNDALHYALASRRNGGGKWTYPSRSHPLIRALMIVSYLVLQSAFAVVPHWSAGYSFWSTFALLITASWISLTVTRRSFLRWRKTNRVFRAHAAREAKLGSRFSANPFKTFSGWNPFLVKNVLKVRREKSAFSAFLTVGFITLSYLVSMNNDVIADAVSVLFGLACVYVFVLAFRVISQYRPEEEPTDWIYSLPLRKFDLYWSTFAPVFGWLTAVTNALALLILMSGASFAAAGLFVIKTLATGGAFILAACHYGIVSYPDSREAENRFLFWSLALVVLAAAFYKYRFVVFAVMILWPLPHIRKLRLYATT